MSSVQFCQSNEKLTSSSPKTDRLCVCVCFLQVTTLYLVQVSGLLSVWLLQFCNSMLLGSLVLSFIAAALLVRHCQVSVFSCVHGSKRKSWKLRAAFEGLRTSPIGGKGHFLNLTLLSFNSQAGAVCFQFHLLQVPKTIPNDKDTFRPTQGPYKTPSKFRVLV